MLCKGWIEKLVVRTINVCHHSASLMMPNGDLHTHDNFLYSQMGKGSRVALQIIQSGIIENRMDRFIFLDLGIKIAAT